MPLSIQLIGTNVDTTIVLNNIKNGEVFNISCAFRINSLRFDPQHYLLTGSNTAAGHNVLDLVPAALQLFPNPATNEITIGELNDATEIRSLQVLNTLGQVELETQPTIENRQLKVNVTALNSGLHFVVLHAKAFTKVLGFLKKD